MDHEILSVAVGGCGIKMGYDVWRQILLEHKLDKNGFTEITDNNSFTKMFEEIKENTYKPRTVFVDSVESDTINEINNSADGNLFRESFISLNSSSHNNFALGYKSVDDKVIL